MPIQRLVQILALLCMTHVSQSLQVLKARCVICEVNTNLLSLDGHVVRTCVLYVCMCVVCMCMRACVKHVYMYVYM